MLHKHAWNFHLMTGLDREEMLGEAYVGFMQACDKWEIWAKKNPGQKHPSKFSTWCYTKVHNHLRFYIRRKFNDRLWMAEEVREEIPQDPGHVSSLFRISLAEQTKDLSPEAQRMIQMIIDSPVADGEVRPRELLKSVCEEMAFEGYDSTHTAIMIHEIKQALAR